MIQKLKAAFDADDRAVSPVIGVILMVAITVILAAVIASMTLGLGDSAQTAPQAKFNFEQDSNGNVTVSHASGATIDGARLNIVVEGDDANEQFDTSKDVKAGSSVTVVKGTNNPNLKQGNTVRIIWTSEDGGTSSTLATYTVQ